jgi:hypothetical protein
VKPPTWLLAALACIVVVAPAEATFRVGYLRVEHVPEAELKLSGAEEDEVHTAATAYSAKLSVPLLLRGRRTILLNEPSARLVTQSYADDPRAGDVFRPNRLWSFRWAVALRQAVGERWAVAGLVQPSLLTDLEHVDADHLNWRAGALVERKSSERFTWGLGAAYADEYGTGLWLPVVRVQWEPSARWSVDVDAPRDAGVKYAATPRLAVGFGAQASGADYRVGEDVTLADGRSTKDGRVKYSIVEVGPEVAYRVAPNVELTLHGGTSVYRRYEVFDAKDDRLIDSRYENAAFVSTQVSFVVDDK